MCNQNDERKFLLHHPEEFNLLEEGIDFQTQIEYIERETINLGNMLYNKKMPVEGKKQALGLLAHLGSLTAYQQIEMYYKSPDNECKQWSALALKECKMFLENTLTDQITGFISSGLGGHKNRTRYYFLVLPLEGQLFTEQQQQVIKDEFNLMAKDLRSLVESFDFSDTYVGFKALVPMDVAVAAFIEGGIKKCNELGEFVFEFYYAANSVIPNEAEIEEIIRIIRSD